MIPKDVLKEIKRIEIRTTRLVNDLFGGEYESVFKGRGIEFADVREYVPGDDIRTIDWNVTARSQHPFVKKYVEERELTVLFVVDGSASQQFGSTTKIKAQLTAEICALLAFSATRNHDKVGMVIYTDEVEKYVPIKKGRSHVLRVVREILFYKPKRKGTKLQTALEYLQKTLKRRVVMFIISDFQDSGYEKSLKIVSQKHDVIAIHLIDPRERQWSPFGILQLEDSETGEPFLVNSQSRSVRELFEKQANNELIEIDRSFKLMGIDKVNIDTSKPYAEPLIRLFKQRERRK